MSFFLAGIFLLCAGADRSSLRLDPASADFKQFPSISVPLWSRDHQPIITEGFNVFENDSLVDSLVIQPIETSPDSIPGNKYVLILIENHFLPKGNAQRVFFKNVLYSGLRGKINKGDKYLVATFDWFRSGRYIYYDGDYSDDEDYILGKIASISAPSNLGNTQSGADIYYALDEALRKLSKDRGGLPANILLLSDDFPNIVSQKTARDVLKASRELDIPIYAVSYSVNARRYNEVTKNEICIPSFGNYFISITNNSDSCAWMVSSFIDKMYENSQGREYLITYKSNLNKVGQSVDLKVVYANTFTFSSIRYPLNIIHWVKQYPLYAAIIAIIFILLIVAFVMLVRKAKKKRNARKEELSIYQQKFNNAQNQINQIRSELERKDAEVIRQKLQEEETKRKEHLNEIMLSRYITYRLAYELNGKSEMVNYCHPILSIGRSDDNMLILNASSVSRHHAQIKFEEDGHFYLVDLDSSNGTFLNGNKVSKQILKDKDRIRIGEVKLLFYA